MTTDFTPTTRPCVQPTHPTPHGLSLSPFQILDSGFLTLDSALSCLLPFETSIFEFVWNLDIRH